MAQNKLFAIFIFLALIPSLEGRLSKFHSEKLSTYKRLLANETASVVEDRNSLQITADIEAAGAELMQGSSPSLTPTGVVVVGSQSPPPGHVGCFRPTKPVQRPGVAASPPPPYSDEHATFSSQKKGPLGPPAPTANTPIHNGVRG